MLAATPSARDRDATLGPSCGPGCTIQRVLIPGRAGRSELAVHDPLAHEQYGRIRSGWHADDGVWRIQVGPLELNLWERTVLVDGAPVFVTVREWEVLEHLALLAGREVSTRALTLAIWGPWACENIARVVLSRLRARLGPAAWVIQSRSRFGHALRAAPSGDAPRRPRSVPAGRLSRQYAWCICCGRSDGPYYGHGRCEPCRPREPRKTQHVGPCGRPPEED